MKKNIFFIILFFVALVGVVINLAMINSYTVSNIVAVNKSELKLLLDTKANDFISSASKYYYQMGYLADKISVNFVNKDKVRSLVEKFVKDKKYVKSLYLTTNNNLIYSYPPQLQNGKLISKASTFVNSKKYNNTLAVNFPSKGFEKKLPETFFVFNKFNFKENGKSNVIGVTAELDLTPLLGFKNHKVNKYRKCIWLLNNDKVVIGSSDKFKTRKLATDSFEQIISTNDYLKLSSPFNIFDNSFDIVLTCNKKDFYNVSLPQSYLFFFTVIHLALILFIIMSISTVILYYYIIESLNTSIRKLKIEVNDIERKNVVNGLGSDEYFRNLATVANKLKEKY